MGNLLSAQWQMISRCRGSLQDTPTISTELLNTMSAVRTNNDTSIAFSYQQHCILTNHSTENIILLQLRLLVNADV